MAYDIYSLTSLTFYLLSFLSLVLGYLIGSISPAYLLGKALKGKKFDIRKHGSKNAGAMNAFHTLGKKAGIITLIFDLGKGALSLLIAYLLIFGFKFNISYFSGIPLLIMCLAGFASILGHDFPFYLNWKGGKGGAAAGGIIILLLILLIIKDMSSGASGLTWIPFIILVFFGLSILIITKSGNLATFITYPIIIILLLLLKFGSISIAMSYFFLYSLIISIINIKQKGGLKKDIVFANLKKRKKEKGKKAKRKGKEKKAKIIIWRKALRFASLIFPILYFFFNRKFIISLIGAIFIIFIILDFIRTKKGKKIPGLSGLYKKEESKIKISGLTWFLLGALVTVVFFQKNFSILALSFAAVGDNFAVILGLPFGRKKIFGKKTLEGTTACLATSLLIGLIWMIFINISLIIVIIGALAATLAELFSDIYDNATMAPFSAAVMMLFSLF